jgi:hypothetical protein
MPTLRIELHIHNLGNIPEYHQDDPALRKKVLAYFDDGLCDEPLTAQVKHFGAKNAAKMLKGEILSWLADLGAQPTVASITITK